MNGGELNEGLQVVQKQLASRAVRPGGEELFKARAQQDGSVRLIALITARLDAKHDCYLATLPSLQLTGGFYAEITLSYDPGLAREKNGSPSCAPEPGGRVQGPAALRGRAQKQRLRGLYRRTGDRYALPGGR